MQTKPTYFNDSYQFTGIAKIILHGTDENGVYIVLDQTIFYPQGGGQPCDTGSIKINDHAFAIHSVRWNQHQIRHYTQETADILSNLSFADAILAIDKDRRIQNCRYHTAGHLLSHIVEKHYPHCKAVKGHHYIECPYVEFIFPTDTTLVDLDLINKELKDAIEQNAAITTCIASQDQLEKFCPQIPFNADKPTRLVQVGGFGYQACGGTHVNTLGELGGVSAVKQKVKGGLLKISYNQANPPDQL